MVYAKTALFTILVQGFATVAIPYILLSSGTQGLTFHLGVWRLVGVSLIALGAGINLFCGWEFAFRGKGTRQSGTRLRNLSRQGYTNTRGIPCTLASTSSFSGKPCYLNPGFCLAMQFSSGLGFTSL